MTWHDSLPGSVQFSSHNTSVCLTADCNAPHCTARHCTAGKTRTRPGLIDTYLPTLPAGTVPTIGAKGTVKLGSNEPTTDTRSSLLSNIDAAPSATSNIDIPRYHTIRVEVCSRQQCHSSVSLFAVQFSPSGAQIQLSSERV